MLDLNAIMADLSTTREHWLIQDGALVIESARIEFTAGRAHVWATAGGVEKVVFDYYTDELSFAAPEFVGKTIEQARALRTERDMAYLRS